MTYRFRFAAIATLISCSALTARLCADFDRHIIKAGKQATALVDAGNHGAGSAFCIDEIGLYVSNHHVVQSIPSNTTVKIVLNAGTETEKVLDAQIIIRDKKRDLAILRAIGDQKHSPVPLGDSSQLYETQDVIAFGFPFGKQLTLNRGKYPTMSVNSGRITALRKQGDNLAAIQIDALVNPGNSGGPLLDKRGKVIGVVVAGIRGSGVNFVIPVNQLKNLKAEIPFILERV